MQEEQWRETSNLDILIGCVPHKDTIIRYPFDQLEAYFKTLITYYMDMDTISAKDKQISDFEQRIIAYYMTWLYVENFQGNYYPNLKFEFENFDRNQNMIHSQEVRRIFNEIEARIYLLDLSR